MNRRRRIRVARRQAAANPTTGNVATPLVASYLDCHPLDWVPDYDNAHLLQAAAGRLSIGDPYHRAPAPITFAPPGRARC